MQRFRVDLHPMDDPLVSGITSGLSLTTAPLIPLNGFCTEFNILLVAAAEFIPLLLQTLVDYLSAAILFPVNLICKQNPLLSCVSGLVKANAVSALCWSHFIFSSCANTLQLRLTCSDVLISVASCLVLWPQWCLCCPPSSPTPSFVSCQLSS